VAASAGYYILAPADTILAHPNSVTGSIGVFAMLPNIKPFMNKKLGLSVDVAKTNEYFDLGSPFRPLSDNERAVFRELVSDSYNSFLEEVADGRSMSIEAVDAIGKGRVWSGENALENGLIDRYGGLYDAIEIAAGLAGLEKYRVTELPRLEDPIDQFIRELTEYARGRMVKRELGQFYHFFETMDELEGLFGLQARLPFRFELN
jgi:protease-4